jgi:hypothetical protein
LTELPIFSLVYQEPYFLPGLTEKWTGKIGGLHSFFFGNKPVLHDQFTIAQLPNTK